MRRATGTWSGSRGEPRAAAACRRRLSVARGAPGRAGRLVRRLGAAAQGAAGWRGCARGRPAPVLPCRPTPLNPAIPHSRPPALVPCPPCPPCLCSGFNSWFRVFDNKGNRRRTGEYAEEYSHDGDSCGIHSSGAGFDKVDKVDRWVPPTF